MPLQDHLRSLHLLLHEAHLHLQLASQLDPRLHLKLDPLAQPAHGRLLSLPVLGLLRKPAGLLGQLLTRLLLL